MTHSLDIDLTDDEITETVVDTAVETIIDTILEPAELSEIAPEPKVSGLYYKPVADPVEETADDTIETAETDRLRERIDDLLEEKERLQKKMFLLNSRLDRQSVTLEEDEQFIKRQDNKIVRLEKKLESLTEENTELTEENRLLEIQNRNLLESKVTVEDAKSLTEKLDTFEGPKDRQDTIRLNRANFVQQKAKQHGGNLVGGRIQSYSFPGGIEHSSLPGRIAVRLPVKTHWLKRFFSDEALHFVNVLEWRFCGIDEKGMAHYACLLDELTEVNAEDWQKIEQSGGAMNATVKLQLVTRDKWILSERGVNYHLENYKVSKMEHHPDKSVRNVLAKSFTTPVKP